VRSVTRKTIDSASASPSSIAVVAELALLRRGDQMALAHIVAHFTPSLRSRLRQYALSYDEASDIIQACWSKVFAARDQLPDAETFDRWLWCIARNACIDFMRCRARQGQHVTSGLSERQLAAIAQHDARTQYDERAVDAAMEWLAWEIQRLPGLQARVAVDRWMLLQSTAQTAEHLGVATGTVKAALHQARRTLRRRLAERPGEDLFAAVRGAEQ
jgi:RNA polymerase sigma-70 factor, ECF subfamily